MGLSSEGRPAGPRLRVATYNVLAGGGHRWAELGHVVRATDADVIALQEIEDPEPMRRMGEKLGYDVIFGPAPRFRHQGFLSRLPVRAWRNHQDPSVYPRNSLEVTVDAPEGSSVGQVRLHTVHLTAAFQRKGRAEPERLRELEAVRSQAAQEPSVPHLILGDFNALAPGDHLRAADFLGLLSEWRRTGVLEEVGGVGQVPPQVAALRWWRRGPSGPGLDELSEVARDSLPRLPWLVHPLINLLPRGESTDTLIGALIPRAAVRSMLAAGYVDCLRRTHPRADSFTCPTYLPTVRIDYIFADLELAARLTSCEVVARQGALAEVAKKASDHFPVVAEFDLGRH
jgi:endonuclease/exonuclease/phosphatase family metal-dependent hydrolase